MTNSLNSTACRMLLVGMAAACSLGASTFYFQGTFTTDDQLHQLNFNVPVTGVVTIQTYSYAGGINSLNQIVEPGGFDPVLTLFDGLGEFLTANNDGACGTVGKDFLTHNCFDSFLSLTLPAGDYTLVLSESDNFAIGPTLAGGFSQSGNGNFSCPEFMGTPGGFCDASPSQRANAWAFDITTPGAVETPEPASGLMILTATIAFATVRKFSNLRRKS